MNKRTISLKPWMKTTGMAKACYDTDLVDLSESIEGAIGNAYDDICGGEWLKDLIVVV